MSLCKVYTFYGNCQRSNIEKVLKSIVQDQKRLPKRQPFCDPDLALYALKARSVRANVTSKARQFFWPEKKGI